MRPVCKNQGFDRSIQLTEERLTIRSDGVDNESPLSCPGGIFASSKSELRNWGITFLVLNWEAGGAYVA